MGGTGLLRFRAYFSSLEPGPVQVRECGTGQGPLHGLDTAMGVGVTFTFLNLASFFLGERDIVGLSLVL